MPRSFAPLLCLVSLSCVVVGLEVAAAQERPTSAESTPDRGPRGRAHASKLRPARVGRRVEVSFQDAALPEVLRFVARVTGRRFILTGQRSEMRLTVVGSGLATPAQVWRLFLDALAMQGMTAVRSGRYYRIVGTEGIEGRATPVIVDRGATPTSDAFGIHLFRVREGSVEDAAALLANFSSPEGTITTYPRTRTLIVTDTGANVRRMMAILRELRTRPEPDRIYIEPIDGDAEALAETLRELGPD